VEDIFHGDTRLTNIFVLFGAEDTFKIHVGDWADAVHRNAREERKFTGGTRYAPYFATAPALYEGRAEVDLIIFVLALFEILNDMSTKSVDEYWDKPGMEIKLEKQWFRLLKENDVDYSFRHMYFAAMQADYEMLKSLVKMYFKCVDKREEAVRNFGFDRLKKSYRRVFRRRAVCLNVAIKGNEMKGPESKVDVLFNFFELLVNKDLLDRCEHFIWA